MYNLAAIVGPTAVGKTSVSLGVAKRLGAEIISCDSMQIYRGMDIGTAKASNDERILIPHHMIDVVDPNDDFSVADFKQEAAELVKNLNEMNTLPLLVGGTGLYYQAVVDDYVFFPMESSQQVRDRWKEIIAVKGLLYAYNYLEKIDQEYAGKISPNDQKRIIRALEVFELTGKPFSSFQRKNRDTYNLACVGLYLERDDLYRRIGLRVDEMLKGGLVEEVMRLREKGYDLPLNSMQALGYKQTCYYLDGFMNYDQMVEEIKTETRRYAKRQYTWFNRDKRINWINAKNNSEAVLIKKISDYLEGQLCTM